MSEEARETRGVHNPHVIDLISLDAEANEVVLLMLEERCCESPSPTPHRLGAIIPDE